MNERFDVIVLGTGAAGLVAALSAASNGLRPLVVEKALLWGGTTALSGGVLWLPDIGPQSKSNKRDSAAKVRAYLAEITAGDGPAASPERIAAFTNEVPNLVTFLQRLGMPLSRIDIYPDYESERKNAVTGRPMECPPLNGKRLGKWLDTLRSAGNSYPPFKTGDFIRLPHVKRSLPTMFLAARVILAEKFRKIRGQHTLARGQALLARLMEMILAQQIPVRIGVTVERLLQNEAGKVTGVVADGNVIEANAGVIICAGGFSHNAALRRKYQEVGTDWTNAPPDDSGDSIKLGEQVGACLSIMDSAWWMPTVMLDKDSLAITVPERSLPHSIIVDGTGKRYMNEAASYMIAGKNMVERNRTVPAAPSWMIFDREYVRRYVTGVYPASAAARERMRSIGSMVEASDLSELARLCNIDPAGLVATVERFNVFAMTGKDEDFRRGDSSYDRYWSDPTCRPNSSLGAIGDPPFTAVKIWPGDLGTSGGLLTDENARVLDQGGKPVAGLWAAGNASASVMGRSYAGAGATLAAAAVFGFIAGKDAATSARKNMPIA